MFIGTGISIDDIDKAALILNPEQVVLREPVVFDTTPDSLSTLAREYPPNLLIDLSDSIAHLHASTPDGMRAGIVELAEKACRLYGQMSDYFNLEDYIFDSYDRDDFASAIRTISDTDQGMESLLANEFYKRHLELVLDAAWDLYKEAAMVFVNDLLFKLQMHGCPTFESGCIYRPDEFLVGTGILALNINLDDI